jgi:hypothetical protein
MCNIGENVVVPVDNKLVTPGNIEKKAIRPFIYYNGRHGCPTISFLNLLTSKGKP